jgi:single-strand DNA-binding protein
MNKITATGRLAADAEVKFIPSGDAICNFRVASDTGFGDKKTTNWFNCAIFGKRGEALSQYLTKGQQVTVFGSLTLREWTNKDGTKQISPDIRIDEIELQGGKQAGGQSASPGPRQAPATNARPAPNFSDMDDGSDIPF